MTDSVTAPRAGRGGHGTVDHGTVGHGTFNSLDGRTTFLNNR